MPVFTSQGVGAAKGLGFSAATAPPATQYFIAYISNASYSVLPPNRTDIYVDASKNFYPLAFNTATPRGNTIPKVSVAGALTRIDDVAWSASVYTQAASYDSGENVYFVGYDNSSNGFIIKLTSLSTFSWHRTQSNGALVVLRGSTVDPSGNVYACGYLSSTTNQGIIVKYDSSGTIQWQKKYTPSDVSSDFYCLASNSSYLFVGGEMTNAQRGYIASINPTTGAVIWQIVFYDNTTFYNTRPYGMVIDSSNNLYVVGGIAPTTGYYDFFAMKINSSGTVQWYKKWASAGSTNERFYNLKLDSTGTYIYAVGQAVETGTGYANCTIFKMATSNGTVSWTRRLVNNSQTNTEGYGIGLSSDAYYVSGKTSNGTNLIDLFGVFPLDGSRTGTYTLGTQSIIYNTYTPGTEGTTYTTTTQTVTVADAGLTLATQTSTVSSSSSTLTGPTSI